MHAHKAKVTVTEDHELAVKLPDDFPAGPAEIIVLAAGAQREPGAGTDAPRDLPAEERAFRARGAREGWFTPATRPLSGPPPRKPVTDLAQLLEEVDEDRERR